MPYLFDDDMWRLPDGTWDDIYDIVEHIGQSEFHQQASPIIKAAQRVVDLHDKGCLGCKGDSKAIEDLREALKNG